MPSLLCDMMACGSLSLLCAIHEGMPSLFCSMRAGMYALHDNVIVMEPLTSGLALMMRLRQPYHHQALAQMLAAYKAVALHLRDRYVAVAHAAHRTALARLPASPEQQRRLAGVPPMLLENALLAR